MLIIKLVPGAWLNVTQPRLFGPLAVNKPSHPQAGEAWSLHPHAEQPDLHRAIAPPTGHTQYDNNNPTHIRLSEMRDFYWFLVEKIQLSQQLDLNIQTDKKNNFKKVVYIK